MARSNLEIAGQVLLTDPDGVTWTVSLRRPNEPERVSAGFVSFDVWEITLRRMWRVLRRDRRWEVRLYEAGQQQARRRLLLDDRPAAMARALELCTEVQAGDLPSQ